MVYRKILVLGLLLAFASFHPAAQAWERDGAKAGNFQRRGENADFGTKHDRGWHGHRRGDHRDHYSADRGRRDHGRKVRQGYKGGTIGGDGLPSTLPGIGTYAGSVVALRVPKVGNYFAAEGFAGGNVITAPKSRIIYVEDGPDCSWEAGVCVIRPR